MTADRIRLLEARARLLRELRAFFDGRGYTEVETPSLVRSPSPDTHIDVIEAGGGRFLVTSPELQMKALLGEGLARIYQVARAFRDGERGEWHNPEFAMLEWYRAGADYRGLMEETEALVRRAAGALGRALAPAPFERRALSDAFAGTAGWDPCAAWDEERYARDFVEKVEPSLGAGEALFLVDFPAPLASQALLCPADPSRCERFELYLGGIEVANGYTELVDAREMRARLARENGRRARLGKRTWEPDPVFIAALERGVPPCAGIALGVDRLAAFLLGTRGIRPLLSFPDDMLR